MIVSSFVRDGRGWVSLDMEDGRKEFLFEAGAEATRFARYLAEGSPRMNQLIAAHFGTDRPEEFGLRDRQDIAAAVRRASERALESLGPAL